MLGEALERAAADSFIYLAAYIGPLSLHPLGDTVAETQLAQHVHRNHAHALFVPTDDFVVSQQAHQRDGQAHEGAKERSIETENDAHVVDSRDHF